MASEIMKPTLDALSHDFARNAQDALSSAHDLSGLARLARTVADDLGAWLDRLAALSCGKPCDQGRAAVLVLGSMFAETLDGPALRVLAAEMARAMAEDRRLMRIAVDFA